ncbi:phosphonate ABC transporter, permease protein PhnE [Candidatus Omnitrophota bacterium]
MILSKKTAKEDEIVRLKMVIVPAIKGQMEKQFRGLVTTIEKITGFRIVVEETPTYEDAIQALGSGTAHMGWLGAQAYLEGAHKANIEAFAVATRDKEHHSTYRTVFLTRSNTQIGSIADLRGKRLVLSQKGSGSGDLMPRHELTKYDLNPEVPSNFNKIIYSGSHEASITSVLSGTSDVAAVSEINYEGLLAKGVIGREELKVIHTSPAIPGAPLVYSMDLPSEIRARLKKAVLNAHKYGEVSGYGENIVKYESQEDARSDFFSSYLRPQWGWRTFATLSALVLLTAVIVSHLGINPLSAITNSVKYMGDLLGRLLPPDFSNFGELLLAMLETIEIGILGTVLATFLAIPIALFSAKNIAPHPVIYYIARTITIFFRAIPEFIMAMILVIAVGFGALPGVLALGLHTMAFLAKFYAEEMEHVSTGPIEALEATGANRYQIVMFAIIPQIVPSFVGFTLYILDRNIRMATMLGIVGAGGIGYRLQSAFRMFRYQEVSAIIIIIFVTIYLIDIVSSKLRLSVK